MPASMAARIDADALALVGLLAHVEAAHADDRRRARRCCRACGAGSRSLQRLRPGPDLRCRVPARARRPPRPAGTRASSRVLPRPRSGACAWWPDPQERSVRLEIGARAGRPTQAPEGAPGGDRAGVGQLGGARNTGGVERRGPAESPDAPGGGGRAPPDPRRPCAASAGPDSGPRAAAGPCEDLQMVHPLAGKPAPASFLVDVERLLAAYHDRAPRSGESARARRLRHLRPPRLVAAPQLQRGAHPGDHARRSASTARAQGIDGPLFLGMDTHAAVGAGAARPRSRCWPPTASRRMVDGDGGYTPTPVISHAILALQPRAARPASPTASSSRRRTTRREDGGFKYNPPNGGPADSDVTGWIEARANALLAAGLRGRAAHALRAGARAPRPRDAHDYIDRRTSRICGSVIDMDAIARRRRQDRRRSAGRRRRRATGRRIAERYGLDLDGRQPRRSIRRSRS